MNFCASYEINGRRLEYGTLKLSYESSLATPFIAGYAAPNFLDA